MRKHKMTREQAIERLKETRELTTDLLEPLGISFESFLRLAQHPDPQAIIEKFIQILERQVK